MAADDTIRASDADRENVVSILRDAYTAGRLTLTEFDERTTSAFAARTWGDLRSLTGDLPEQAALQMNLPRPQQLPAPNAAAKAGMPDHGRQAAGAGGGWHGASRIIPALPIVFVWLSVALFAHSAAAFVPIVVLLLIGLKSAAGHHPGRGPGPRR